MMEVITRPVILEKSIQITEAKYLLYPPAELIFFKGHFHDKPILPGIIQVKWAIDLAKPFSINGDPQRLEKIKFTRPVQSETRMSLILQVSSNADCINFRYFDDNGNYSSGQLFFSD